MSDTPTWNNVPILYVKVIMRSKNIARYHRRECAAMLLRIASVQYINHSLSVAVAKVAVIRRSQMHLEYV